MARLGDICSIQSGGTPSRSNRAYWDNGTIPWVKISDFSGKYLNYTSEKITQTGLDNSSAKIFPKGTILYTIFATLGETCILEIDATTNQAIAGLKLNDDSVLLDYLYYYLLSKKEYVNEIGRGVAQNNINMKILREMEIAIPSKDEQNRITGVLNKVYTLIALRKEQLAKLDELVKSRFIELFGDPVSNPLGWQKKSLKEVCIKLNDGTHFSPKSFETGEYKYVTAKNIKMSGFDFTNITYVPEETHRPIYERCNPELGDVLYIKDGVTTGIAIVNTLEEEFTLLSSVALLKQDRRIMSGYFLTALLNNENMYTNIRSNMGGAAITRLTIAKLNGIQVILPPMELQEQFAAFVEQTDKSKLAIQQSLDKLELLKKSLMQQYFG